MVQKRLLSWNPAEAKMRRETFAAHAGAGAATRIAATTKSSPAIRETSFDFIGDLLGDCVVYADYRFLSLGSR
jgi:hypothetical protein